jgi:hypothetical protein
MYTDYEKGKGRKPSKRMSWEKILESLKLKLEHHTCCIKMQLTVNQIKKI